MRWLRVGYILWISKGAHGEHWLSVISGGTDETSEEDAKKVMIVDYCAHKCTDG